MMAEQSYEPVIGSQFMAPHLLEVIVDTNSIGYIVLTEINHKIMFKVKPCNTSLHHQRLLLDADDRPVVMLREKMMSGHKRWNVFRGDSNANSDMIFSAKTAHAIRFKTNVQVFMENNNKKKGVCDFKIEGSWSKRNCTICVGDSSTIIARMHTIKQLENVNARFVKDIFLMEIYPNVDYAFVVALIAIVDAMESPSTKDEVGAAVIHGVFQGVTGGVSGS